MQFDAHFFAIIFGVLFGISEALGLIPEIKQNSIYQVITSVLAKLAGKKSEDQK